MPDCSRLVAGAVVVLVGFGRSASADEPRPSDPRRQAVVRGLRIIETGAANYPKHRQCFSCHHQTLPLFAMAEARESGLKIDQAVFDKTGQFTRKSFQNRLQRLRDRRHIGGRAHTTGYGLWAFHLADEETDELATALVAYLLREQRKDGRWVSHTKRPPLEGAQVTPTVLAMYTMQQYATDADQKEVATAVETGQTWLARATLESQEDHVFRLWGLKLIPPQDAAAARRKLVDAILERQQEDGGWGQTGKMKSDAYATGQTVYVLQQVDDRRTGEAVRRGIDFLLKTQHEDGSWKVVTRADPIQVYFDNGDPHGKSQFISMAATSWAVAALAVDLRRHKTRVGKTAP